MSKPPGHAHTYYPISCDEHGEPAIWICGVYRACIKTVTRKEHAAELRKAQKKGLTSIDMEAPDGI